MKSNAIRRIIEAMHRRLEDVSLLELDVPADCAAE